jgi:Tol biopolymer transport system component
MALDNEGFIFVTGSFQGSNVDFDPGTGNAWLSSSGGSVDIFIAKYDPAGNYLWAKKIGGASEDIPGLVTVDGSGNAIIGGWFSSASCDFDPGAGTVNLGSAGYSDIFFAKYDTDGNYIWAKSMGSTGYDGCHDIRTDQEGNILITGYFNDTVDFNPGPGVATLTHAGGGDLFFAKYDPSGNYLWAKRAGGSFYEVGNSINTDNSGNIYLSGPFMSTDADFDPGAGTAILSTAGGYDMYLAKYDAEGNYLWAKRIGGSADDIGGEIEIDRSGNLLVIGVYKSANIDFDPGSGVTILSSGGGWDLSLSKFTAAGTFLWADGFGGTGDDYHTGLTLDAEDNVYLCGLFSNTIDLDPGAGNVRVTSGGGTDCFYAKFGPSGNYVWSMILGGRAEENGGPVTLDLSGHLYTVLNFNGSGVDMDPGQGTFSLSSSGATDLAIIKFSLLPEPGSLSQLAFSNTGPDGNNEIYTIFSDGTGLTRLTNSTQRECGPAWSPDGSKIAFYIHYNDLSWSEFIMDIDGATITRLTNTANVCDGPPSWSPDGRFIAFGRWYSLENYRAELWVMNADGTNQHRVGNFSGDHPAWSPDGSKIAICYHKANGSSIAVVNPDGSNLMEISTEGNENWWPAWSPDGEKIAFQSNRSGDHEVYVIRADGSNPVRLTDNPGEDGEPDWSPDGKQIAYSSMVNERYVIKIMNSEGSSPLVLASLQEHNINPAWKPIPASSEANQTVRQGFSMMQNYPNPVNDQTTIEFTMEKEGPVKLDLMDINGKLVNTLLNSNKTAGKHYVTIDLTSISPGSYFFNLYTDKSMITKKLIKQF